MQEGCGAEVEAAMAHVTTSRYAQQALRYLRNRHPLDTRLPCYDVSRASPLTQPPLVPRYADEALRRFVVCLRIKT